MNDSPNADAPWHATVSLPALLRHARTTYGGAMRRALDSAGFDDVPGNGLYVIGAIALGEGGIPIGRLVRDLGISKQAAGQLVDALVLRGYIARTTDETDRRRLIVTLTDRGRAAADVQTIARRDIDDALEARVGARDVAATRTSLAALIDIGRAWPGS